METGAALFTAPAALRGPVIGDIGNWADRTPVHDASRQGQALQLRQLIESGVCVNLVTVDSITPLHEACLQGHIQCVKLLLAAGAQVDARNIDGSTPLCDASASGSLDCMKVLLDYGAKVNPPLYTASPLHEACMSAEIGLRKKSQHAAYCYDSRMRFANILYGVQVRRVGRPIEHSNAMVSKPFTSGFGTVSRCQVVLKNEIFISIKHFSRWKHEVLQNLLIASCIDPALDETQWTNTSS
ncbi:unnamed protein product [Ranitomeya imitator]|uniref:Ankyrin repeat and SOCS box protein 13 n=1 Tax=Ranitomeya imitator TaxID=111125 RepID=A0ABN9LBT0_9NEOB|nr:unnamed protein product [Ranitomeya imitator]